MQALFELCRFRNAHPAFNGTFELLDTVDRVRAVVRMGDAANPANCGDVKSGFLSEIGIKHNDADEHGVWCGAAC